MQYFSEKAQEATSEALKNDMIHYCLLSCKMLSGIVSDILDFAQIKEGKFRIQMDEFSLSSFFKDVLKINQFLASKKQLNLFIENHTNLINDKIYSDKQRLSQVLNNLISNAIKFTEKGFISIKAKQIKKFSQETIQISVRDTGVGIKKEVIPQLCQPYQTFDRNGLNSKGIGIGLYLSKRIIQQLGPQENFIIKSAVNQGTKFTFNIYFTNENKVLESKKSLNEIPEELQFQQIDAIDNDLAQRMKIHNVSILKNPNRLLSIKSFTNIEECEKYYILVADDNVFNIIFQMELQKAQTEFNIQIDISICNNGQECLEEFIKRNRVNQDLNENRDQINLIFMDLQMPIMDGLTASAMIQNQILEGNCFNADIILCSAQQYSEQEEKQFEERGIRSVMQKPFTTKQLKHHLQNYLFSSKILNYD